MLGYSQGD